MRKSDEYKKTSLGLMTVNGAVSVLRQGGYTTSHIVISTLFKLHNLNEKCDYYQWSPQISSFFPANSPQTIIKFTIVENQRNYKILKNLAPENFEIFS